MPQLSLNEERQQFRDLARDFAENEIKPKAAHFDQSGEFPEEIFSQAWQAGLSNFQIPVECEGLALGALDVCLILEELAAGCSGIAGIIEASVIAQLPLILEGTTEQQQSYLLPLQENPLPAGFASFNPRESDLVVSSQSGGSFMLNGSHNFIVNGGECPWYIVTAYDGTTTSGGGWMFVVPHDTYGLVFQEQRHRIGRRALPVRRAAFNNVLLSREHLIGEPGKADQIVDAIRPSLCSFIAAGATGVARSAMQNAIAYSKERQTFGRPISQHQAVAFMLADMAREIEAARLMTWQAAYMIDEGAKGLDHALMAKAFAQDMAMRVTTDAVQVYGGYGYTREYPVEKLMRDAKQYQIYEESSLRSKTKIALNMVTAG